MKEIDYVKTLLHELVHLKQWVEGSLAPKSGRTYYKGMNVSDIKYYEQPHEIEAFKIAGRTIYSCTIEICVSQARESIILRNYHNSLFRQMQLKHIEHPEDTILTGDLSAINWFTLQGKGIT